jgi:glycosyltransferase involved in cell wall biosynthesis
MVANLHTFKDHRTLIKAWRTVVDKLSEIDQFPVLLLAGRFDDTYSTLKELTSELNLDESVRFLGQVNDVSGLLSAVDLGVHSSVNEGCPNGVLECMAAGLPVVGTDYPGIREAIGPNGYGFLAPPTDADALGDQIVRLARDPEMRRQAGLLNRSRIENEFGARTMYEKTLAVIREALDGSGRERRSPAGPLALAKRREAR